MTIRATTVASLALCCVNAITCPIHAADQLVCLKVAEQSAAVAAHEVIPLGEAIKKLRKKEHKEELMRARLCMRNGDLYYVLTMLTHSGKVISIDINAVSGDLAADH
jgi:uncharacterized membrane protein YkoI